MYTGSEGLAIAQVTSWLVEELDWDLVFLFPCGRLFPLPGHRHRIICFLEWYPGSAEVLYCFFLHPKSPSHEKGPANVLLRVSSDWL